MVFACAAVSWVRKGAIRMVTSVECGGAVLYKDPGGTRNGAPGARVLVFERGRMGSCSEEGTDAKPSSLRRFSLYSRCSYSSSLVVQRE